MAQRTQAALQLIDEWVGERSVPGVGAVVWYDGQIIAERYVGEALRGSQWDQRRCLPWPP